MAEKVQGRRTTADLTWPLALPPLPAGGVRLVTGWVEPAYLEPDASWCEPGGELRRRRWRTAARSAARRRSVVAAAARELADRTGRMVRVLFSREDVVRLGPKRPPIAATARFDAGRVAMHGVVAGPVDTYEQPIDWPYRVDVDGTWERQSVPGPPTATHLRAAGFAERVGPARGSARRGGGRPRRARR